MQNIRLLTWALLAGALSPARSAADPLGAVLDLVDQLVAKIQKDSDEQGKVYNEYKEWCDETVQNTQFASKTAAKEKAKLEAQIIEFSSDMKVAGSKIEELVAKVSSAKSELKKATTLREQEHADFAASEAELMEAVDAMGRAIGALEKEASKNPAAFAQVIAGNVAGLLRGLDAVMDAAALSGSDRKKLMSFVQSQEGSEDEDEDEAMGAPAVAAYKNKGGNIVELLQDMKEKADGQLSELRAAEVESKHNYDMLEGALTQEADADAAELDENKAERSAASESKASAEGDLEVTTKELAEGKGKLAAVQASCLKVAADQEITVAAEKEELNMLAKAKKTLVESTSGAASFLQVSASSATQLLGSKVVKAVRQLARQHNSASLAQLASQILALLRHSSEGSPFGKVKGLIQDMIAKLEKQAGQEAQEKAYCDEQMAKTEAKKGDLEDSIEKLTSRFDQATAKSAELKEQVKELENELSALAKEQAELDNTRREDNSVFLTTKADEEKALSGIRKALGSLRDYYGSSAAMIQDDSKFNAFMQQPAKPEKYSKSAGAGGSIIDILELCESDIATGLAKVTAEEDDAQSEYETITQENAVAKATAEQGVKYKTQESKALKATLAEITSDRDQTNTELAAVQEYYGHIQDRCVAKPETYEKQVASRTAEVNGLKEALAILEDETALLQRKRRSSFRGALAN